ncbi:MAG TPA: glycosyltransferase family 2 protein [Candidatus Limnocylindria bacterium]|nr:glycosyltransferase family 2 protein [Candidatus Limnocylindria bacterium]
MDDRLPLSILLLAADEERRLAALLPELGFARDVVVVVDARTRDGTRQVAARHAARVVERTWEGFGPQRQFGLAQCREPWVLWLDADERLERSALDAVRGAVSDPGDAAGYRLERRTWFLGRRIRYCGWQGERLLRLFRRDAARFDDAPVHERVIVDGRIAELPGVIEHHSYERWQDCRDKLVRYAAAGAERSRRAGRRAGPLDVLLRPPLRFIRMYLLQGGFLDGAHGLVLCALAAAQVLLKYAELWAHPRATPGRAEPPG